MSFVLVSRAIAVLLLAQVAPAGPPDGGMNGTVDGMNLAPQAQTGNAPAEAQLSPPPDAEKVHAAPGFIEVQNPAFPSPEVQAVAVHRGRRYDASDFSPYFGSGALAEAKAHFDQGRYGKARALLQQQGDAPPVRYLRALAALRGGDFAAAAVEMTQLADEYPALRDRCLTHGGVALEELKRWKEAAAAFAEVPEGSRMFVDARLGLARVLRRQGDVAGAAKALEPLAEQPAPSWGRDVGAEALLALADLSRHRKDPQAEQGALVKLWSNHPLSPLALQAERRLGGAAKLGIEAKVRRGEVLVDAHRNRPGLEVLGPLLSKLDLPDPLACRAHFTYGKALRKERRHAQAIAALAPVVARCTDGDLKVRALYVLASSRSIVDLSRAAHTYEQLVQEFPAHSFADDALFYAADVHVKAGDTERALERLSQAAEEYPDGDFAAESLFKSFWILRAAGRAEEGLAFLEKIERQFGAAEESYEVERARYWKARTLETGRKRDEAAALLERLALDHPATYYGLMARTRLEAIDPDRAARVASQLIFPTESAGPWPLHAGPMGDDPHFLAGVELLRLGFPEAVSSELLAVDRSGQAAEAIRLLVKVLSLAGDARSAHAIARVSLRKDLAGRITTENRAIWELAYPNAFRELIEKHCRDAAIEPDLLQALMREESALDPTALSWAGAIGLTQLMPSTATAVARRLKIPKFSVKLLLDPDVNIRLGAAYLGSLHRRFKGVKQFALAGYNAGERAVDRWRQARPDAEIDAWVEDIPIAETRGYVKRVLRSYNTYRLLYGAPPDRPPVTGGR